MYISRLFTFCAYLFISSIRGSIINIITVLLLLMYDISDRVRSVCDLDIGLAVLIQLSSVVLT